jgi:D-serine deaminase-like pyridoxal phosphate-dependent protein
LAILTILENLISLNKNIKIKYEFYKFYVPLSPIAAMNLLSAAIVGACTTLFYLRVTNETKEEPVDNWRERLQQLITSTTTKTSKQNLLMSIPLTSLRTPAYLLYFETAVDNATQMLERAKQNSCVLRPHVKTHKTLQGGYIQTGGTCSRIVCSTLREVVHFSRNGFDDIVYAVPITPDKLNQARELSLSMKSFSIMVDNAIQLNAILKSTPPSINKKWNVVVMVDCGYGRDGILPESPESIDIVKRLHESNTCRFAGLYTHGGHSYDEKSKDSIRKVSVVERDQINLFSSIVLKNIPTLSRNNFWVGVGSTPTCSVPPLDGLSGIDEIHPGNYFVYDCTQSDIGSCNDDNIATRVMTRVIGHYKNNDGNMLLIDLGWTGTSAQGSDVGYGRFENHPELTIHALKQEAGEVVSSIKGKAIELDKYPIGSFLRLMPHHSCASGAMHEIVHVVRNKDSKHVVDQWKPCRGW